MKGFTVRTSRQMPIYKETVQFSPHASWEDHAKLSRREQLAGGTQSIYVGTAQQRADKSPAANGLYLSCYTFRVTLWPQRRTQARQIGQDADNSVSRSAAATKRAETQFISVRANCCNKIIHFLNHVNQYMYE